MKELLTSAIDFFYPPFRKIMPLQTFRYAACGGANALLGLLIFFIGWKYLFAEKVFDLGFFAFESYSAALLVSSAITFIIGFITNRYLVFTTSNLRGRIQFIRYFLSFFTNLLINYALLKLLVKMLHLNPMFSQVFTTAFVILISYFTQRHFTFKVKKTGGAEFTDLE
ncbi:MAG: GtrA family protein [Gloeobacteraceae cyanobacterium ES-bin-316]|nr:GtrA family protein [Ferruginibacter sp.]